MCVPSAFSMYLYIYFFFLHVYGHLSAINYLLLLLLYRKLLSLCRRSSASEMFVMINISNFETLKGSQFSL